MPIWQDEAMTPSPAARLGARLRALRLSRDVTQAQLSAAIGISESTLSRLESGGRKATLDMLLALAGYYEVSLDELVHAPATADPRVIQRPFTQSGSTIVPLGKPHGGLQAFKQIITRSDASTWTQKTHEGFDWIYVLSGRLRLLLGEHDLVLTPGEAAEFDTRVPHAFGSADGEPVEVLSLFGTHGERMHVRASTTPPTGANAPS
jgi:transcriptional regulator with XRE-family HTH domain